MSLQDYFANASSHIHKSQVYYYLFPVLLIAGSVLFLRLFSRRKLKLPPGPTGLPLVGYLPFLGKEPFKDFHSLCKTYGNVYSLYLGRIFVVILGDDTAGKEAFSKNTTTGRPSGIFDVLPGGIGFAGANGTEWIEQRRLVIKSMRDLGLGRSTWSFLVEDEVSDFLNMLAVKKGNPIDIEQTLNSSIASNIGSLIFGKRLTPGPERDALNSAIDRVMLAFSQAAFWGYFPWLWDVLVQLKIPRYYKSFCELSTFNTLIRKQVDICRQSQPGINKDSDFINSYVEVMNNKATEGYKLTFHEKNLIGNTQALYVGGTDTTKGSLMWLYLAMAAYPEVQEKVHQELDSVLDESRTADWEDRVKFPYVYATIMEGQRWRTVIPLNLSRLATEDIEICGYSIPKGSTIIANNWGLHNDARYWSEPENFIPDRFLRNDGKEVILKPESYVPFSYGKRKCPGETVALIEIFLYFTAVMQIYEVKAPNGGNPKLDGLLGLSYQPVPQEICFLPR